LSSVFAPSRWGLLLSSLPRQAPLDRSTFEAVRTHLNNSAFAEATALLARLPRIRPPTRQPYTCTLSFTCSRARWMTQTG
jgi:hypothetical protein